MVENLAKELYEAYRAHTGGKSAATGKNIPPWEDLPDVIQHPWQASANKALALLDPPAVAPPASGEFVTVDDAIALLNGAVKLDQAAMTTLFDHRRVPCNADLASHPTIQVVGSGEQAMVGVLGVLNGLFGVDADSCGPITIVIDDDGMVTEFRRTDADNAKKRMAIDVGLSPGA